MKSILVLLLTLICHHITIGQTPEPHEVRFRLYNESGELLTCDSLHSDTLDVIELSANFISYEYDPTSHFHIVRTNTFYSNLSLHWVRNQKVMDLIFFAYDTIARNIEYCSFDHVQFEEGQFDVKVRTNTSSCETYEASKEKYFENVAMIAENEVLHYTWNTLEEFSTNPESLCSRFDAEISDQFTVRLICSQ